MSSSDIDGSMVTKSVTRTRFWRRGMPSSKMLRTLGEKDGLRSLRRYASSLKSERQPVQGTDCIGCPVRQTFLASLGETLVRVVSTTRSVLTGMFIPFNHPGEGHTSRLRCVTRLQTCNPSTSAWGACLPMGRLTNRMSLVILLDETRHVSHQLGAGLPAVPRGWIPRHWTR